MGFFRTVCKRSYVLRQPVQSFFTGKCLWSQETGQSSGSATKSDSTFGKSNTKGLPALWGTKKHKKNRKVQLQTALLMMDMETEKQLQPLRARVKEQGDRVRAMKAAGAAELDVKEQVVELKARRKELEDLTLKLLPGETFDRARMADLVKRRFYYDASFAIYGGITGQYDLGPVGCELVDNLLAEWHQHFVLHENMLKISTSILTPECVLKASGHVDKFADYMVKDVGTGECYRLDHLIKLHLDKRTQDKNTDEEERAQLSRVVTRLDGMTMEEMNAVLRKYDMKAPASGNDLSDATVFNLMFPITIGPSGSTRGFLRPETAQGIFVNFKRLLEHNQGKLPFACAQIGNAYRNEISPRSGLLRVREFTMAEVEHFCYPDDKTHAKFPQVADEVLTLFSAEAQMSGHNASKITIAEAVHGGLVANETLGYYMARIQQYLHKIGITPAKLRFRQHMANEMAHYACDCWDAECLTSYGWVECVGCADRSAYDLKCHSKATGVKLTVERLLAQPKLKHFVTPVMEKGVLGKVFKKEAKSVMEKLSELSLEDMEQMEQTLNTVGTYKIPGSSFEVTKDMVPSLKRESKTVHVEEIVPSVIEPSFGIGRVFYSLLEHSFRTRKDNDKRTFFALPALVAPVKVALLPLSNKQEFMPFIHRLESDLSAAGISRRTDDSTCSIGRRYVRTDELAVPYAVTVDFDTLTSNPNTVTLRERDSTQQVRLPVSEVVEVVRRLSEGRQQWSDVVLAWPKFNEQTNTE